MDKFRPIIISGPSGSGKDTIIKLLISRNKNIHDALGYTTREPRDGEKNGREILFTSVEHFKSMIENNQLIEYAKFAGNYYGMPIEEVKNATKKLTVFNVGISGAKAIKQFNPNSIAILILPSTKEELLLRLGNRGIERFERARQDVKEAIHFFDYLIISPNNLAGEATSKIEDIIFDKPIVKQYKIEGAISFLEKFFD